ncbi:MAG: hypothetical protein WKF47_19695 [Geodermatophilaceae bacterium]
MMFGPAVGRGVLPMGETIMVMSSDQRPGHAASDAPPAAESIDRRTMVRRSAVVLAGTAGLLAAPAMLGTAAAESGDSLRLGGRNRADDAQTRLQSTTTVATLSVLNEHVRRQEPDDDVDLVAAQLRLEGPVAGAARPQVPDVGTMAAGDLAAAGGLLYFGAEAGTSMSSPARSSRPTSRTTCIPYRPDMPPFSTPGR